MGNKFLAKFYNPGIRQEKAIKTSCLSINSFYQISRNPFVSQTVSSRITTLKTTCHKNNITI